MFSKSTALRHWSLEATSELTFRRLCQLQLTYRTANLQSCILYIYSTNIGTEYFKHGIYSPFFPSSKCSLFHNSNVFGSCIIHILYTGCAKIKKNNSGAKRLSEGTSIRISSWISITQRQIYLKVWRTLTLHFSIPKRCSPRPGFIQFTILGKVDAIRFLFHAEQGY